MTTKDKEIKLKWLDENKRVYLLIGRNQLCMLLTLCHLRRCKCPRLHKSYFVHRNTPQETTAWNSLVCLLGEYPIAVIEYCCQDIESERQRSADFDCQVHSLLSFKTKTRNQRRKTLYCSYATHNFFLCYKVLRDNNSRNLPWLIDTILNNSVGCNSMLLLGLAPVKLVKILLDIESLTSNITNRISFVSGIKIIGGSLLHLQTLQ